MKIKVTKEYIKKGKRKSQAHCPIALALKRKGFSGVIVREDEITLKPRGLKQSVELLMPRRVEVFIHRFDNGVEVKPFSFTL